MTTRRRRQLRSLLIADAAGTEASPMSVICERTVRELAASGVGATVLSYAGERDGAVSERALVYASNAVSAALEDLQLTVGEGPCLDTFVTGGPVLVPELETEQQRWPGFAPAARRLGAAAVYSFPLQVGVVRLGSIDLYRDRPGSLRATELADALILADLATEAVIEILDGHATEDLSWLANPHAEVHQAAGMVQVQLDSTTEVALLRLRGFAYMHDLPLLDVAKRVVARTLRFDREGPR